MPREKRAERPQQPEPQVTGGRGPPKQREGAKPVLTGETEAQSSAQRSPSPTCIHGAQTHPRFPATEQPSPPRSWLDLMILEVFSNLNDSVILRRDPRAQHPPAPPAAPRLRLRPLPCEQGKEGKKRNSWEKQPEKSQLCPGWDGITA